MNRLHLRLDWVLAAFIAVMNVSGIDPVDPPAADCRGGVLYGTVWGVAPGSRSGAGTTVYALRTDRSAILGSSRTDAAGRYRICGLPLRTRFDLVAVPPDPSAGVIIETITLTLSGGQQRNVYPTRALQRLPDLILRHEAAPEPVEPATASRAAAPAGQESVVASQIRRISEAEALARAAAQSYPPAERRALVTAPGDVAPPVVTPPPVVAAPPVAVTPPTVDFLGNRVDAPDASLRVVSGDGLLMYFSGEEPRYMQLRVPGTDGRGCYFEFDWGIDEQKVEAVAGGYLLQSPAWGQIGVRRDGDDRVSLDLSGIYTPVCRVRSASGGPVTWQRTPDGWVRTTR